MNDRAPPPFATRFQSRAALPQKSHRARPAMPARAEAAPQSRSFGQSFFANSRLWNSGAFALPWRMAPPSKRSRKRPSSTMQHFIMTHPYRRFILGGLVLLGLGAVAVAAVPLMLDGTRQGQLIAAQIAKATGQRVQILGTVDVSVWPRPHIAIHQFSLVSPDKKHTWVRAPRLDLNVSYASLFSGVYAVDTVTLIKPEITLLPAQMKPVAQAIFQQQRGLPVHQVYIEGGTLTMPYAGRQEVIKSISGQVSFADATTWLNGQLKADWRGAPLNTRFDIAAPVGKEPSLASLDLDIGAAETTLRANGTVDIARPRPAIAAQVSVTAAQGATLWSLLQSLNLADTVPQDALLRQPLQFKTTLEAQQPNYALKNYSVSLGDFTATGGLQLNLESYPHFALNFAIPQVKSSDWQGVLTQLQAGQWALNTTAAGTFDGAIDTLTMGGASLQKMRLQGAWREGQVQLSSATAEAAGQTKLSAKGTIAMPQGRAPQFDVAVEARTAQLRGLLDALSWRVPLGMSEDALRRMAMTAMVQGRYPQLGLDNIALLLDDTRIVGDIQPPVQLGGLYHARLSLDQLNLAPYTHDLALPASVWSLPPMQITADIKQAQAGALRAEDVRFMGRVNDGILTVDSLDAADFSGNKLRLSGSVSRDSDRNADLNMRLVAPDFSLLKQNFPPVVQLMPALLQRQIEGGVDLSVRWRRAAGEQQRLSSARFKDGSFDVVVSQHPDSPTTWKARLQGRDTAAFLRRYAPAAVADDVSLGALDFYMEGSSQVDNRWQVSNLQGQLGGLPFKGGALEVILPPADGAEQGFNNGQDATQISGQVQLGDVALERWVQGVQPSASMMQGMNIALNITADSAQVASETWLNPQFDFRLAPNGSFAVNKATARWRDGAWALDAQGEFGAVNRLSGTLDIKEANVTWRAGDRFGLSGMLDFNTRFAGQGRTWAEWQQSLTGDGEFTLDSGALRGMDFVRLSQAMQDKAQRPALGNLLERGGETPLSTLSGSFSMEDGKATGQQVRLRAPSASADITAELDLAAPARLDALMQVSLREVSGAPPFTLQLGGALSQLEAHFQSEALNQFAQGEAATKGTAARFKETKNADAAQLKIESPPLDIEKPAVPASDANSAKAAPPSMSVPLPQEGDAPLASPDALSAASGIAPRRATNSAAKPNFTVSREGDSLSADAPPPPDAAALLGNTSPRSTAKSTRGDAPPSIPELLAQMPRLNERAAEVVRAARQEGLLRGSANVGTDKAPAVEPPLSSAMPRVHISPITPRGAAPNPYLKNETYNPTPQVSVEPVPTVQITPQR